MLLCYSLVLEEDKINFVGGIWTDKSLVRPFKWTKSTPQPAHGVNNVCS